MGKGRRKRPAGMNDQGGYCDTLEAFEKYCDWGDATPEQRRALVLFVGTVLPYIRQAFKHPVEFAEWLAAMHEATPESAQTELTAALHIASALVDAEKRPGRISKAKARDMQLRVLPTAELKRFAAAWRRIRTATGMNAGGFRPQPGRGPWVFDATLEGQA